MKSEKHRLSQSMTLLRKGFFYVVGFSFLINLLMLTSPLYMLQVYDRVLTSQSLDSLVLLSLIVVAALATMSMLEVVRTSLMVRMSEWLDKRLSGALLTASVYGQLNHGKGADVQGLRDLGALRNFLTGPSIFPFMDAPWAPVYLAVIFLLHPVLGWVALGGAVLLFTIGILNEVLTRKPLQAANRAATQALNDANAAVRNADVIEAMGFLPNLVKRWQSANGEGLAQQAIASKRSSNFTAMSKFLRLVLQSAMLGGGAYFAIIGEMTPGSMIASSILLGRALSPVEQAISTWKSAVGARQSYGRMVELLAATPMRGEAMPMPSPKGIVSVESLNYAFPKTRELKIKNASFNLAQGEMMGLIGPSGSGKTTLSRLLLGNLTPTSGHARLDDFDMSVWEAEDRGQHIGYLPQDVELFSGTVRENISRMGEADPEQVVTAAKMAGVHEMIARMPQGYDTEIGENGVALSGGERQRIALARALFGQPKLIVLDEPNASLDREGEQSLIAALKTLKQQGVTTIVIAHRPAVLQMADKILVLQQGMVKSFGERDEVLGQLEPVNLHERAKRNKERTEYA